MFSEFLMEYVVVKAVWSVFSYMKFESLKGSRAYLAQLPHKLRTQGAER